ncbi:MAG: hypothetical protein KatS3mg025_1425 [Bacteroidia bacterium]|nr:MAG: hypothetical protein KatS3mg025_1425 [Bacteroidia bacterium]
MGPAAELFQAFRKEVLALSPEVTEEFRKLYMAYKVRGANFVSVVPRKASLRFFLNLNFDEVHDPRGLCRDVTHVGRWGTGNVELRLRQAEDIDYLLSLVRRAFEKQRGVG